MVVVVVPDVASLWVDAAIDVGVGVAQWKLKNNHIAVDPFYFDIPSAVGIFTSPFLSLSFFLF